MSRLWRRIRHEFGLKVASLVIALVLWAWRSSEGNPIEERRFGPMPVKVANLAKGLVVVGQPPLVEVTLVGPRLSLDQVQARRTLAPVVDCADIERPSWPALPVTLPTPDTVQVKEIKPAEWEVEIDTFEVDVRPIRADLTRAVPPEDYVYEAPQLSHTQAQVSGPRKLVSRVASLLAEVDFSGRVVDYSGQARLVAVDAEREVVDGVTCEPRVVNVTVRVARLEESRGMTVVVRFAGEATEAPAGYLVTPSQVTVSGMASALDQLGSFMSTMPVEATRLRTQGRVTAELAVPSGVKAEPTKVTVVLPPAGGGE